MSSANPENVSLFIKSVVALAVLFGFDQAVINSVQSELANLCVGIGMVVSSVTALYGLYRKVKLGRWSA